MPKRGEAAPFVAHKISARASGARTIVARGAATDGAASADDDARVAFSQVAEQYPRLTRAEERALLRRAHGLDGANTPEARTAARDRLVECNLRLVLFVATRYLPHLHTQQRSTLGLNELLSVGQEALLKAIEGFDVEAHDNGFATYAIWWLRQACSREAKSNRLIHLPSGVADALDTQRRRGAITASQARYHARPEGLAAAEAAQRATFLSLNHVTHGKGADIAGAGDRLHEGGEHPLVATLADPASVAEEGGVTDAAYAEALASDDMARWLLAEARAALTPRELAVFLALTLEEPRPSGVELRARFGVSREYVRQIYRKARTKLYTRLRSDVRSARLGEGRTLPKHAHGQVGRAGVDRWRPLPTANGTKGAKAAKAANGTQGTKAATQAVS